MPSGKPPGVICAIVGASLQAVGLQFWKLYYLQKERMEAELEHGTVREIQVHREFHSVRDLDLAADQVVAMDASIASSRSPSRVRQQETVLCAEDTGHAAGACMQATAQEIQIMSPVSEGDELAASTSLSPEASASFISDHTCTGESKQSSSSAERVSASADRVSMDTDIRASAACAKERADSLLIKHGFCAPNPHCVVMVRGSAAGRARCLQPVEIEAGCQPSGPSSPTARAHRYIHRWEVPNPLFEFVRNWWQR